MANKKPDGDASKDQLRQKLAEDMRLFLDSGGEITLIPTGQSGVDLMKPGQKNIKLGNKK